VNGVGLRRGPVRSRWPALPGRRNPAHPLRHRHAMQFRPPRG